MTPDTKRLALDGLKRERHHVEATLGIIGDYIANNPTDIDRIARQTFHQDRLAKIEAALVEIEAIP